MEEDKNEPEAGWVFKPGNGAPAANAGANDYEPKNRNVSSTDVSWSASEYISHPKNMNWFAMLAAATVALAVIVYFITSDVLSAIIIVVLGIIVGVFAARQPRVLDYQLDNRGIHMGVRFYPYGTFKSFSVINDGAFSHISLLPLRRFMPPMAIHYSPEDEKKIMETLGDYLPYEKPSRDLIESFSRKVRF